ncbi:MAG: hypothetical protein II247_06230 [Lachnospiraceae bacterium]|nr:hypothetical protein [Lachnospiraceae bacterium]
MLYKKYRLYDEGMEIMIPSHLKQADSFIPSAHSWMSEDRRLVINVARGGADLPEMNLSLRLNEYYKKFSKDISNFECRHIKKRRINGQTYGEMQYLSQMMGYCFFNIFLLGAYEGRELIVTIQCIHYEAKANMHIFENISDSLRFLRKRKEDMGDF